MDDVQIVQLYWDRNEQAIPATANKYDNYCTSIARNILANKEDAEECVNFGMTENNVSVTLNRLRHRLKKYFLERGFEL